MDESHDSSVMDLELMRLLTGENENLCLICDVDQSIYAFRGAKIEAVMNMRNIYPNMKIHLLNTNYRSTETIVEASKSLINNNTKLIEKKLKSNNETGNPIIHFKEKNSELEATRIVKLIKLSVEKYGYEYKDVAILYRMNYLSKVIEKALLKYRIPYKIINGTDFYSRKEIKIFYVISG
jgi:DNA helicase-2/ATP-dependent DNA helicase PcrA